MFPRFSQLSVLEKGTLLTLLHIILGTNEEFNTRFILFMILFQGGHNVQHSYPVLVARRGQGRRLPPTPCKPSTLQLKPSNINFPKLNASPTHVRAHPAAEIPFEQNLTIFF